MHIDPVRINIDETANAKPLEFSSSIRSLMWVFAVVGFSIFVMGFLWEAHDHLWAAFYSSLLFFMGISVGGVMISAIFQIVKAQWSLPIRRLTEANVAFLPWAYLCLLTTYFGREYLFTWARSPMPGREFWMEPNFVYVRYAILLGFLFYMMWRFVRMSVQGDLALARNHSKDASSWGGSLNEWILAKNAPATDICALQHKLSWNAPLLVALYAIIYSLFAFEMVMGMNPIWYSNMFGGFIFIGNIYCAWAVFALLTTYFTKSNSRFGKTVTSQQFHDLGNLTFGFAILWAYLFISQFMPIWYGNLPEETQWMILRTREYPWKGLAWIVLPLCFIIPFITMLSRDVVRTPKAFSVIACLILVGMWLERYIIVMPEISPAAIPFGLYEVSLFFGFLGLYVLAIAGFLSKVPSAPLSYYKVYGEADAHH